MLREDYQAKQEQGGEALLDCKVHLSSDKFDKRLRFGWDADKVGKTKPLPKVPTHLLGDVPQAARSTRAGKGQDAAGRSVEWHQHQLHGPGPVSRERHSAVMANKGLSAKDTFGSGPNPARR